MTTTHRPVVSVDPARTIDVPGIVEVYRASRFAAFDGLVQAERVLPRSKEEDTRRWAGLVRASEVADAPSVSVASIAGDLVGVALLECNTAQSELGALYIAPTAWGHGAGGRLLKTSIAISNGRGHNEMTGWVLGKNMRAKAFFLSHGGWLDGAVKIRGEGASREVLQRVRFRCGTL